MPSDASTPPAPVESAAPAAPADAPGRVANVPTPTPTLRSTPRPTPRKPKNKYALATRGEDVACGSSSDCVMSTHRDAECAPPQPPAEFRQQYALNKEFASRLVPHLRAVCGDAFRMPSGQVCAGLNCYDNPPVAVCQERRCVVGRGDDPRGLEVASPKLKVSVDSGWTLQCDGCAREFSRHLQRRAQAMHRCWEQSHRKQPRPSAAVTLEARLGETGVLSKPTVVVDDVEPSFGQCLAAAVRRFRLSADALDALEGGADLKALTVRGQVIP